MKKIIVIALISIGLVLTLLCSFSFASNNPEENDRQTRQTAYEIVPAPAETENMAEEIEDRGYIEFVFWDLDDFKTYMATGSRNQADYVYRTSPPASVFFPVSYIEHAYVPLESIFDLNDNAFDTLSQVSYGYNPAKPDNARFTYYFETYSITVEYAPSFAESFDAVSMAVNPDSCYYSQYYADRRSEFTTWDAAEKTESMMLTRGSGKYSAAYYKEESGNVYRADVIAGDYWISFQNNYVVPEAELEASYAHFRTSEETAYFAAFFSEDDAVFNAAVDKLCSALAGK